MFGVSVMVFSFLVGVVPVSGFLESRAASAACSG